MEDTYPPINKGTTKGQLIIWNYPPISLLRSQTELGISLKEVLLNCGITKKYIALGKNMLGELIGVNVNDIGNCLVVGLPGSGKTSFIRSLISSLLFLSSPEEIRFILIDPKGGGLTDFNGVPHLLTPVIIDSFKVVSALKWIIGEMERRCKELARVSVKNIESYNNTVGFQAMPNIVTIIDDIYQIDGYSSDEVEDLLSQIVRLGRTAGVQLIMSLSDTNARLYRTLKAFFQTRICFNTSTVNGNQTSSKPGTERLIPGDFFLSKNSSGLTECLESVFVSDLEVTNLVTFLKNSKNLPSTFFPEPLTSSPNQEEKDTSYEEFIAANKDLIDKFCEIATRKISTIDEYGNENWEALNQEKQRCFLRVASKLGLSERFLTNTFLELDQQEAAGLSDQTLASKLGSQLRFALQQINKEYVPLSYHLVKLYFIDLEKILREYYGSHEKIQKTPANFNDLSGVDFEVFIEKQLKDLGFGVVGTPVTGDQGADIVADKDGKKYVIQAKRYTSTVGNKAVQEVVAAKNFYQGDIAVVITNSKFTPAAKDLAQKNKVLLVDGDSLTNLSKLLESFNQ